MTPSLFLALVSLLAIEGQGLFSHPIVNSQHGLLDSKIQMCNLPMVELSPKTLSESVRSLSENSASSVQARFQEPSRAAPRSPAKPDGGDGGRHNSTVRRDTRTSTPVPVPVPAPPAVGIQPPLRLPHRPPVLGRHHAVPLLGLGFVPTRGQALFIAYLWILNISLTAASYPPSATSGELVSLVGHRAGLFSFANLALAVLYSSRNSLLLHMTDWSHATFLLLHRWTAVISILQACLHSAIFLQKYHDAILGYAGVAQKEYLIWGVVALVAMVVLIPTSTLPLRRRAYEVFLASHIVLSAAVLTGSILHIFYRYGWRWEYQAWIVAAVGVWGFDRLLARPVRILRNGGLKGALVTVVDPDYLMIEVPGVAAEGHAYLYFPSLSWRVWENHPFSVAAVGCPTGVAPVLSGSDSPASLPASAASTLLLESSDSEAPSPGPGEKSGIAWGRVGADQAGASSQVPGIVFFVRCRGGLTTKLRRHARESKGVKVLVESSYGVDIPLVSRCRLKPYTKYSNLVCIAGGVGITAMLPLLKANAASSGKTELYWGVRSAPLVEAVARAVGQEDAVDPTATNMMWWGHANVSVLVGRRFDLKSVLDDAVGTASDGGTTVAVCGPPGMADEVRVIVAGLGRRGLAVKLREESFAC
ncbi:hypothetical protein PG988_004456 [Apiospora saccharicola]